MHSPSEHWIRPLFSWSIAVDTELTRFLSTLGACRMRVLCSSSAVIRMVLSTHQAGLESCDGAGSELPQDVVADPDGWKVDAEEQGCSASAPSLALPGLAWPAM
jgi:hypothetical protein